MIANSGGNEWGGLYGGEPGDQTGREWRVMPWYSCPWYVVLRHPNQYAAHEAAVLARHAAGNDLVGYNQLNRLSFWQALEATGTYDPADITEPCDDDCSAGVTACYKAAGCRLNIPALASLDEATYTGNLREHFMDAGFELITSTDVVSSPDYLLPGDVLLRDNYHVAINLDCGDAIADGAWHPEDWLPKEPDNNDEIGELIMVERAIINAPEGMFFWDANARKLSEIETNDERDSIVGIYTKDGSFMPTYEFIKEGSVQRIRDVLAR